MGAKSRRKGQRGELEAAAELRRLFGVEARRVLTDFRVDGLTLQTKSRAAHLDPAGDESDWTTKHTGTDDCPEA
jgi:hypothetical protein